MTTQRKNQIIGVTLIVLINIAAFAKKVALVSVAAYFTAKFFA